ncbi:MAG: flagellar basal-body MS-ring/collar protein FliF [Candidatus Electryonea clarkiae]|nr:flagellar basal-body MS-ring/collar protein FliF [Candidatus Electryonea clarkiae]
MPGLLGQLSEQFGSVFRRFTVGQQIAMVGVMLIAVAGIVGVVKWAGTPDYVQLYSNLPAEEAGRIADWLTENKIEYKLEQGGSRILVPQENLYDSRIRLAQEGMPRATETGYEIFDQTNLGMSEFVQKLNYKRALEGELSRTIEQLDEVESARVHIVIPEPALFRDKENPTTASIALKLRVTLKGQRIAGISHLVAAAVEGLEVDEITIIDSHGNVLSDMQSRDPLMALSATQLQMKEAVERSLTNKVSTMLESLLGPDKAIVRVSTELDFSKSEVTSELYDPELVAVRSEESIETQSTDTDQNSVNPVDPNLQPLGKSSNISETNAITNYEISKTISHTVSHSGGVKKLTSSVLVDGAYETITAEDGTVTEQYVPITQNEMNRITVAVRNALGIDETRGDQLSVQNIAFKAPKPAIEQDATILDWLMVHWYAMLKQIILGAAIIGVLVYIQRILSKSSKAAQVFHERRLASMPSASGIMGALPGATAGVEGQLALPDIDSEVSESALEASQLQQRLIDFVKEKPETAASLLKSWLVAG